MSDWWGRSHVAKGNNRKGRRKEEEVRLSEGRDNGGVSLLGE